ncbi:MAG: SpoIIE family protein phosphatase [Acidobacteriaceae bacterium]|nr:SpoIIE family protein phosphatase [Acidobacteriaceae bacterium]MBV9778912.1 SpoIIE family protein phosphatase [Acidobacteriaceae bacterium]
MNLFPYFEESFDRLDNYLREFVREQLLERRNKLEHAIARSNKPAPLELLLEEVDGALERMETGSFGVCETCHQAIEHDRLVSDPLTRVCLSHLSKRERDALENDLQLAARVQQGLLPKQNLNLDGWQICYHYEPAGLVSGDYCDFVNAGQAGLYFMVGDVSGKGVAASMLMAHLHAMFRTLISVELPLKGMLDHANRVFSESTLPNQYATLVCGRALPSGRIEVCNAGHPAPLVFRDGDVRPLETFDLPVGMFAGEEFSVTEIQLESGQGMVIYSDGLSEATDSSGSEYGAERLRKVLGRTPIGGPSELVTLCRQDLAAFCRDSTLTDDVTLFVLGRNGRAQ